MGGINDKRREDGKGEEWRGEERRGKKMKEKDEDGHIGTAFREIGGSTLLESASWQEREKRADQEVKTKG